MGYTGSRIMVSVNCGLSHPSRSYKGDESVLYCTHCLSGLFIAYKKPPYFWRNQLQCSPYSNNTVPASKVWKPL